MNTIETYPYPHVNVCMALDTYVETVFDKRQTYVSATVLESSCPKHSPEFKCRFRIGIASFIGEGYLKLSMAVI